MTSTRLSRAMLACSLALAACDLRAMTGVGPALPDLPEVPEVEVPEILPLPEVTVDPSRGAGAVRFLAVGDAGRGNEVQLAVGRAMTTVCAARGCDFVLSLGDNFYDDGVESIDDSEFTTSFETPYAGLDLPFYVVNGNHDLAWDGHGFQAWKADLYVQYSSRSTRWTMPAPWYNARVGDVELFAVDTTMVLGGDVEGQRAWLASVLQRSNAPWKVVFGHHPYRSNGDHGDAREPLASLLTEAMCGRADVYLSGHDHTLQWLHPTCGVELIVSGAGSGTGSLEDRGHPARFQDDTRPGFVWLELAGDQLTGAFYDRDGVQLFTEIVRR